jgi:hypothetical protein
MFPRSRTNKRCHLVASDPVHQDDERHEAGTYRLISSLPQNCSDDRQIALVLKYIGLQLVDHVVLAVSSRPPRLAAAAATAVVDLADD